MTTSPDLNDGNLEVLAERFVNDVHRALLGIFLKRNKEDGLEKSSLADLLGVHKSLVTRRLSGASNLTLEVVSDMARAMKAKPVVTFLPYEDIPPGFGSNGYDPIRATSSPTRYLVNQNFSSAT